MVKSFEWVYEHLVCEFNHWDICLIGLVEFNGKKYLCKANNDDDSECSRKCSYTLYEIDWNEECDEYLEDYKVAYKHWFHENGKRPYLYNNWDLSWFSEKWKHRNPIEERIND